MEAKRDLELLENASVRLKITLSEEDVRTEWDTLVADYCEKAQIKGFRRGRVPRDVLIRKFGDSIKVETAQNLMERSLRDALPEVEHKPLPYVRPELREEIDLEPGKPFAFEVFYDTFPQVELGSYKELPVEEPSVQIGDEDMQRELEAVQRQNAVVVDKPDDAAVEKDDTVTIDYVEVSEDGTEDEKKRREGFTFAVGTGYNLHKIDDDILGMKKGEERVLEKDYPADFEYADLAGRKVRLKVKVTAAKQTQLPEIDDELAQDVSDDFKTLDDLKKAIQSRLEEARDERVRSHKIDQIIKQVVEGSKIVHPEAMVQRDLELRWREFVRRMGGNEDVVVGMLGRQERRVEDLLAEWRPAVEETIRRRIAIQRVAEAEKVQVDDAEVEEEIRQIAEAESRQTEEVMEEYRSAGLLDVVREDRRLRKSYDLLLESAKVKKGKKVKFLDFMQRNG